MKKALTNAQILTGGAWRDQSALLIDGDHIEKVVADSEIPPGYEIEDLAGGRLLPGFIDVQVNGGGGMMLNDARSVADIAMIARAHRRFGTTGLLPTLITDDWARMTETAALIREAMADGLPGLLGVHFEGPYLNPARKGVHDEAKIRRLDEKFVELVTAGDLGRVVVTLAPERVPMDVIRELAANGVIVSAGHSAASYDEAVAAFEAGVTGITHLYNGMPPMQSREPGLVGAAVLSSGCYCGIINDGHHVHPATLKAALTIKGSARMMLVTDAMASVGTEMTSFRLGETEIRIDGGRLTTADGTLAGSNLDMAGAVRNAVALLGLPLAEAAGLATENPAAFLGLDQIHGRIAPGFRADLVLMDGDLRLLKCWIGGV